MLLLSFSTVVSHALCYLRMMDGKAPKLALESLLSGRNALPGPFVLFFSDFHGRLPETVVCFLRLAFFALSSLSPFPFPSLTNPALQYLVFLSSFVFTYYLRNNLLTSLR